ncbi:hypothetical protein K469DRAFT_58545 [Zopfia rhizophila CBS 207.26]|uniref:Uncharacterized protein n=1 Tax=Zopfia rhizophila CBS 207.26 TaxID=1314779 RepID=A0A6A6EBD8_9PEZI|nr:hypothetical protein K469DRAFT_58545 [Zopfia rhizophila CBS 207.26]
MQWATTSKLGPPKLAAMQSSLAAPSSDPFQHQRDRHHKFTFTGHLQGVDQSIDLWTKPPIMFPDQSRTDSADPITEVPAVQQRSTILRFMRSIATSKHLDSPTYAPKQHHKPSSCIIATAKPTHIQIQSLDFPNKSLPAHRLSKVLTHHNMESRQYWKVCSGSAKNEEFRFTLRHIRCFGFRPLTRS